MTTTKAKIILNPYAGRWTAQTRMPEAETALKAAGVEYEIEATQGPGHGTELALQAARQGYSPIIAAGGDGSISEVVNGLCKAVAEDEPAGPLGIIPLGSANDLVANLKLPKDLAGAARVIAAGKTRQMDLGCVNGRYFDNNAAIGLEPSITLIQQRIQRVRGTARYLLATVMGVMQNPKWHMDIEWEGGEYHGPSTLVTVGNGPVTGGLFYMAPHADVFDGKLTFVYGYMSSRRQILQLLPRTMKPDAGSYVEHPNIHEVHSSWLRVRTNPATPLHADGEIQSTAAQEIDFRLLPGKLKILMP